MVTWGSPLKPPRAFAMPGMPRCNPMIGGHLRSTIQMEPREFFGVIPSGYLIYQWIGLRENLQETMVFTVKLIGLSGKFSHHPIL
jgi:hypothetical protein